MLVNDDRFAYVTYILNIAVFPKYRRYGVGSYFLQRIIKRYSGEPLCGGVYLHTLSDSAQNISFYQSNGFQRVQVNEGGSELGGLMARLLLHRWGLEELDPFLLPSSRSQSGGEPPELGFLPHMRVRSPHHPLRICGISSHSKDGIDCLLKKEDIKSYYPQATSRDTLVTLLHII